MASVSSEYVIEEGCVSSSSLSSGMISITFLGLLEDSTMVASTMAPLRLFYYYLLLLKLTVYLLKEPGVEIEFKEGIPKPAYGRVVR